MEIIQTIMGTDIKEVVIHNSPYFGKRIRIVFTDDHQEEYYSVLKTDKNKIQSDIEMEVLTFGDEEVATNYDKLLIVDDVDKIGLTIPPENKEDFNAYQALINKYHPGDKL